MRSATEGSDLYNLLSWALLCLAGIGLFLVVFVVEDPGKNWRAGTATLLGCSAVHRYWFHQLTQAEKELDDER